MQTKRDLRLNVTMPEIHNGTIRIGDGTFVGDITSLNLWSMAFTWNMIVSLALNPGNAAGDIFSWKRLMEQSYQTRLSVPSTCRQRPGKDNFPLRNESRIVVNRQFQL